MNKRTARNESKPAQSKKAEHDLDAGGFLTNPEQCHGAFVERLVAEEGIYGLSVVFWNSRTKKERHPMSRIIKRLPQAELSTGELPVKIDLGKEGKDDETSQPNPI